MIDDFALATVKVFLVLFVVSVGWMQRRLVRVEMLPWGGRSDKMQTGALNRTYLDWQVLFAQHKNNRKEFILTGRSVPHYPTNY